MTTHVTSKGQPLGLGSKIKSGGEGTVFNIVGQPDLVAKIYHHPPTKERVAKIKLMAECASPSVLKMTAWPRDLVLNGGKIPVGFIMPKVAGHKDIHHLYNPKSRKSEFPEADFDFLVRTAANVARAFAAVHETDYVIIGDVNHGSVTVADDATVKLLDCDSLQFLNNGKIYFCDVGVSTFTPPELQGKPLRGVTRTKNHDNFGLAILIFHLLVMGRHPFSGRFLGRGDMPIETAIQQFRYAYGLGSAKREMEPPPNVPSLISLSPAIAELFERAFARHALSIGRPDALEWVAGLVQLSATLARCDVNPRHAFASSAGQCPWCQIESATGVLLFNVVFIPPHNPNQLDIGHLWRSIEALTLTTVPPAPREQDIAIPQPATGAVQLAAKLHAQRRWLPYFAGALIVLVVGLSAAAANLFWLWSVGAFFLYQAVAKRIDNSGSHRFTAELSSAEKNYQEAQRRYSEFSRTQFGVTGGFLNKKKQLQVKRDAWNALPASRAQRLKRLEKDRRKQQLEKFLGNFFIDHASISGIGPGRKAMLTSFGIQTAAEVERHRLMAVPGFGQAMTKKLTDWRQLLERQFKFDPSKGVDLHHIAALDQEIDNEKRKIYKELMQGITELAQQKRQVEMQYDIIRRELERSLLALAQARANRKIFGG
jgi:DNA-binding helix-hairpin-helix protein with protein kinase domain